LSSSQTPRPAPRSWSVTSILNKDYWLRGPISSQENTEGSSLRYFLVGFAGFIAGINKIYSADETNVSRETFLKKKCLNNAIPVPKKAKIQAAFRKNPPTKSCKHRLILFLPVGWFT